LTELRKKIAPLEIIMLFLFEGVFCCFDFGSRSRKSEARPASHDGFS